MRAYRLTMAAMIVFMLSACGAVDVQLRPNQTATGAQGSASPSASGQLSAADLQATVEAQVQATITAQQAAQASASPSAASSPSVPLSSALAGSLSASTSPSTSAGASASPTTGTSAEGSAPATTPTTVTEGTPREGATTVASEPCATPAAASSGTTTAPAAQTESASPPPAFLLILDSSGSMLDDDGTGKRKIDTAKEALKGLIDSLPDGAPVGLRVYGHRVPNTDKANGCQDTELIAPIAPLNKADMKAKVDSFQATGFTPISTSLEQAANDLPAEGERTIVLVSDGEETCDRDPCQAAKDLLAKGIDVTVETVGFRVNDVARAQLECIAEATGGAYHDVSDAAALAGTLRDLSTRALKTYQTVGTQVSGGDSFNNAAVVQAGRYQDSIKIEETLYYAINLQEDQALRLTSTIVGQPDMSIIDAAGVSSKLQVYDSSRQEGGSDFGSAGVDTESLALETEPVREAGMYYFSLAVDDYRQDPANREFQTEFIIEIVDGPEAPCTSSDEGATSAVTAVPPGSVSGGDSFNNAPLLQAGQYQDTIKVEETLYYAVQLQENQRIRITATIEGQPDISLIDEAGLSSELQAYSASRQEGGSDFDSAGRETKNLALETEPVRQAGTYYFSLSVDDYRQDPVNREFQTELIVTIE